MLRKITLLGIVALVAVGAGQANEGKELRVSGEVVRASAQTLSVENLTGDAVLTCAVPARLAEQVAGVKTGDKVRMVCVRYRGRKAELVKVERLVAKVPETKPVEKQEAAGLVAELGPGAIVVQGEQRLACRVPAEKQAKLEGLKVGERVKLSCVAHVLVGLERYEADRPAVQEVRLYGKITTLSRDRVTVLGEAGSLSCFVPATFAEKLVRFAVGDSVKMMCRGSELTYLEKP
ncbi:MAG TPA: hypothetical protein VM049_04385 [Gaiellaceae bacterium]|nr:hypothetical protein [Gaiellaceae bacterium]